MKLEHSFEVRAPLERVWATLIDVERVAPCLPGAELTEAGADGVYRGTFTVRLGPTTAAYQGELRMERIDEADHSTTMRASGRDKRGQGSAKAAIVASVREEGGVTTVEVETDLTITGRLARFGRGGMIQDVSNRLLRDFASCLQQTIEAPAQPVAPEAPVPAADEGRAGVESSESSPAAPSPPPTPQAEPVRGLSLLLSVLRERIRRLLHRRRR